MYRQNQREQTFIHFNTRFGKTTRNKGSIRHAYRTRHAKGGLRYTWNFMNLPRAVKLTRGLLHLGIAILNRRSTSSHSRDLPKISNPRRMLIWKAVSSYPPMQRYHQIDVDGLMLHNKRRNQLQKKDDARYQDPKRPFLYWSTFGIRRLSAMT